VGAGAQRRVVCRSAISNPTSTRRRALLLVFTLDHLKRSTGRVLLVVYKLPQLLTAAMSALTTSPWVLLALINVVFLLAGMFIEANAAVILFVPILYPLTQQFGIDGLHLGIVLVFNLCLGLITPPVGLTLSLAAKMADAPLHKAFVESLPFLCVGLLTLLIITYIPATVTWLPSLVR
jgi:TRAP-type C4-dicarboxylate transport system permease large subunit